MYGSIINKTQKENYRNICNKYKGAGFYGNAIQLETPPLRKIYKQLLTNCSHIYRSKKFPQKSRNRQMWAHLNEDCRKKRNCFKCVSILGYTPIYTVNREFQLRRMCALSVYHLLLRVEVAPPQSYLHNHTVWNSHFFQSFLNQIHCSY